MQATLQVVEEQRQWCNTHSWQCSALKNDLARRLGTPRPGQRIHNVIDWNIGESADHGLDHVASDAVERVGRRFWESASTGELCSFSGDGLELRFERVVGAAE